MIWYLSYLRENYLHQVFPWMNFLGKELYKFYPLVLCWEMLLALLFNIALPSTQWYLA